MNKNINEKTKELVVKIKEELLNRCEMLATAESCTGGLIASNIINEAGSSSIFSGGIIAYQNKIKESLLRVPPEVLEKHGAVSKETVIAMAENARKIFNSEWGVSTSGIAGPGGEEPGKPVGFVWMCVSNRLKTEAFSEIFDGTRNEIREKAVYKVLNKLLFLLNKQKSTCTKEH